MSENGDVGQGTAGAEAALEGGSYEVLHARLRQQARALAGRAEALNERRRALFSGAATEVLGTERIRTVHNCVARDVVGIGPYLLFGFNVFLGLKATTKVSDVLSLHRFERTDEGFDLSELPASEAGGFLEDPAFVRDFEELYRYYKDTRLEQLVRPEGRLLIVFKTGTDARDVKVFRFEVGPDGAVRYIDNRGERDSVVPETHDFEWLEVSRDDFVRGAHPHVAILDEVFVETVGGDLTVKVEDNTEDGLGIYREPVDDPDQSLDDARILFARVGTLILLKVLPYREETWRYLVYNPRTQTVTRIDAIGLSCVQLPEDQGLIFPGGYYLETGDFKVYDQAIDGLELRRVRRAPNGEDVLYTFHHRGQGRYVLLPYNLVRQEVQTPIQCHGYSLFDDGRMAVFRATSEEASRVHPMQIWQTPFVSDEVAAASVPQDGSFLSKVGNAELVRAISEALTLQRLAATEAPTRRTFEDVVQGAQRLLDGHYWLDDEEVGLKGPVESLGKTADLVVGEYEKVIALRRRAAQQLTEATAEHERLLLDSRPDALASVEGFMSALDTLRRHRGRLGGLREEQYIDVARIDALDAETGEALDEVSVACVAYLEGDAALAPLNTELGRLLEVGRKSARSVDLEPVLESVEGCAHGVGVLSEVVGGLTVGDPVVRAGILERISEVFSEANRVRAILRGHRKELLVREGRAQFAAQFKLFGQSIESALALCDTPEACDAHLSRLTVQLEELEGRFAELDELLAPLTEKREQLHEAFGARRQALLEERQRRGRALFGAAERILQGIGRRAASFSNEEDLHAYFASDPMVQKLRDLAAQLLDLGDPVRADELGARIKTARQEAARGLRDKKELFEAGTSVIRFGAHRFNVNTRELEATVVPHDERLALHLTGSDFYGPLEGLESMREYWSQTLPSETPEVYRAEYLAASLLLDAEAGVGGLTIAQLHEAARLAPDAQDGLLGRVRRVAAERYDEGYERGVHDLDAARLLEAALGLHETVGLLRFAPLDRALASMFWSAVGASEAGIRWRMRAASLGRLRAATERADGLASLAAELRGPLERACEVLGPLSMEARPGLAARYLVEVLATTDARFVTAQASLATAQTLREELERQGLWRPFEEDLAALQSRPIEAYALALEWLEGHLRRAGAHERSAKSASARTPETLDEQRAALCEAAAVLVTTGQVTREGSSARTRVRVEGLLGSHPRLREGAVTLALDELLPRMHRFVQERVPGYRAFREALKERLEEERARLRLEELKPRVLSSFVRNRLIAEVYLPLIGQNLAKQLGEAGEEGRTDRMGLLLMISPPGYGKTTLMEYVAARLGLTFVKVNGPSIGHDVTSLDPAEAGNLAARQEVERINLAFEMGNNVMLYLDDIQHLSPELLQKFISLCDGQRRVEGVWRGKSRTYDLRGKKFCVVMAGNPYTETGDRFSIPDMLANRADTYNLGDVLSGKDELFALSFIENALTSNPTLTKLSGRDPGDLHKLLRMADGEQVPPSALSHGYSQVELQEMVTVLRHLRKVQAVLLQVNQAYIESAAQDDRFRREPPFKLQGSYRNMAKLAEKVVPALTSDELEAMLDDHYVGESQTLTTDAEHNLLKLAELRGRLTPSQKERWESIKRDHARVKLMGGAEDDPVARVLGGLGALGQALESIREVLAAHEPTVLSGEAHAVAVAASALEAEAEADDADGGTPAQQAAALLAERLVAIERALTALGERALASATASAAGSLAAASGGGDAAGGADASSAAANAGPSSLQTVDVGRFVDRLEDVLLALADRPSAAEALQHTAKVGGTPAFWDEQIDRVQRSLAPLARMARRSLKEEGGGSLRALQVWQHVSEALQLLQKVPPSSTSENP